MSSSSAKGLIGTLYLHSDLAHAVPQRVIRRLLTEEPGVHCGWDM